MFIFVSKSNEFENGETEVFFLGFLKSQILEFFVVKGLTLFYKELIRCHGDFVRCLGFSDQKHQGLP